MRYLYLINCDRYFKIGVTNDVPSRLAKLYTGNPFEMDVSIVYEFGNSEPVERSLHQRFQSNRVRGEWFALSADDVAVFKMVCNLLGGKVVDYEEAVFEAEEDVSKSETWRVARKTMSDAEIVDISTSSVEEIVEKYSLSVRTASNWRAYARKELDLD